MTERRGLLRTPVDARYPGAVHLCFLGEAPGPNTRPFFPLYPLPPNSAGGRLRKMLGLSLSSYMSVLRCNLVEYYPGGPVPLEPARQAADRLLASELRGYDVVGFGRRVAAAMRLPRDLQPFKWHAVQGHRLSWAPHPSGQCRLYNDEMFQLALKAHVLGAMTSSRKGVVF